MYYIYHIKSKKIGVSMNPQKRVAQQGYTEYEILEEHTCIDRVSVREMELQKQYGYRVDDTSYKQSHTMQQKSDCSSAGKKGGAIAGKITSELKIGLHNPEKRKEYSQAGVRGLYAKYTPDELKQIRGKGSIKKRKLTQEQIDFVKKHYYRTQNQHEVLPPGKMSVSTLANMFNVSKRVINWASKS